MRRAILIILLFSTFISIGQNITLDVEIDTNRIKIGEHLHLDLRATLPAGLDLKWPVFPDSTEGLDLVSQSLPDTTKEGSLLKIHQHLVLTSFDSGYFAIPPFIIQNDGKNTISEALAIEVIFPQVDEQQDYFDIKEPMEVGRNWIPIILLIVGGLLFLGLVIFLISYLKKNKSEFKTPEIQLLPHEYALMQLKELEEAKLWQSGHLKEYYSRLIDILRVYVDRQMHISTMESTADEMIAQLKTIKISKDLYAELKDIIKLGAMVKYAKEKPGAIENERALNMVRQFIADTRPVMVENKSGEDV